MVYLGTKGHVSAFGGDTTANAAVDVTHARPIFIPLFQWTLRSDTDRNEHRFNTTLQDSSLLCTGRPEFLCLTGKEFRVNDFTSEQGQRISKLQFDRSAGSWGKCFPWTHLY
jgi:hypothetical protein